MTITCAIIEPFFFIAFLLAQGTDIVTHQEMGQSLVSLHSRVMSSSLQKHFQDFQRN